MRSFFLLPLFSFSFAVSAAQDSTAVAASKESPLSFSAYVETYYSYDINKPVNGRKPDFIYNYNKNNEFNLNLGLVKAAYLSEKVRGNVALGVGTYMEANYASESDGLKNIFEANAGFKVGKKNLWIDMGIFPSHIGFESAIGKDNSTLTRSMMAENSPYYESGAKISYTSLNDKWFFSGLLLNGWQRISRIDGNSLMSVGTQITFKPSSKTTLNHSSFIGTATPDSIRKMRYFNNFYGIFQLSPKVDLTAGLDVGMEEKGKNVSGFNNWYTAVLMGKFKANTSLSLTARLEYYHDPKNVIISTTNANGFKTIGGSINADYNIANNMLLRVEARTLNSDDAIFRKGEGWSGANPFLTAAFCIGF